MGGWIKMYYNPLIKYIIKLIFWYTISGIQHVCTE